MSSSALAFATSTNCPASRTPRARERQHDLDDLVVGQATDGEGARRGSSDMHTSTGPGTSRWGRTQLHRPVRGHLRSDPRGQVRTDRGSGRAGRSGGWGAGRWPRPRAGTRGGAHRAAHRPPAAEAAELAGMGTARPSRNPGSACSSRVSFSTSSWACSDIAQPPSGGFADPAAQRARDQRDRALEGLGERTFLSRVRRVQGSVQRGQRGIIGAVEPRELLPRHAEIGGQRRHGVVAWSAHTLAEQVGGAHPVTRGLHIRPTVRGPVASVLWRQPPDPHTVTSHSWAGTGPADAVPTRSPT